MSQPGEPPPGAAPPGAAWTGAPPPRRAGMGCAIVVALVALLAVAGVLVAAYAMLQVQHRHQARVMAELEYQVAQREQASAAVEHRARAQQEALTLELESARAELAEAKRAADRLQEALQEASADAESAPAPAGYLSAEQITSEALQAALEAAGNQCHVDRDGDLVAQKESRVVMYLRFQSRADRLTIFSFLPGGVREESRAEALAALNRANSELAYATFSLNEAGSIIWTCELPCSGGLLAGELDDLLESLDAVARLAYRTHLQEVLESK